MLLSNYEFLVISVHDAQRPVRLPKVGKFTFLLLGLLLNGEANVQETFKRSIADFLPGLKLNNEMLLKLQLPAPLLANGMLAAGKFHSKCY